MNGNKLLDFIQKSSALGLFKINFKTYLCTIYYDYSCLLHAFVQDSFLCEL